MPIDADRSRYTEMKGLSNQMEFQQKMENSDYRRREIQSALQ